MEQQSKKHLSPWIAWAIVALMAGIAGFCIWYYFDQVSTAYDNSTATTTPTTSTTSTADWKTYSNTKLNYSFDYPSTVKLYSFTGQGDNTAITNDADIVHVYKSTTNEGYIFEVSTEKTSSTVTLNDAYIKSHYKDSQTTQSKIDGIDGFTLESESLKIYFAEKNSVIYQIQYVKNDTTAANILSTFQFTE